MSNFIRTTGVTHFVEEIIVKANEFIYLVCPYLDLSDIYIDRLKDAERRNISVTIIYGKEKLKQSELNKLNPFKNIELLYCQNLHAKCYFNEKELVITSMNLYKYSERYNREIGVLINKNVDSNIYIDNFNEIESIINTCEIQKPREAISKEQKKIQVQVEEYNLNYNFHLPALYEKLKSIYENSVIDLDKTIKVINFPRNGITLIVDNTIDLKFETKDLYDRFKIKFEKTLYKEIPKSRIYWNYKVLDIYPPENFSIEQNEFDKNRRNDFLLEVITKVNELWKTE